MKLSKRFLLPLAVACVATALPRVLPADEAVYQKALRSTVLVVAGDSVGSGALIDAEQKLVVTNFHVVDQCEQVTVCFPHYEDGRLLVARSDYGRRLDEIGIPGRVAAGDPKRDLALIRLESLPEGAEALPFAEDSPTPGERIHSIGNPGASDALWVYTSGTVRQVYPARIRLPNGYLVEARIVEAQSPVNPGDSGGPVVNDAGELVGIVQSFQRDAQLVSHCIDVTEVRALAGGDVKTIDRRVREALDAAGLKYTVSTMGTFLIDFRDGEASTAYRVCVDSSTSQFADFSMRDVWSVVHTTDRPVDGDLASKLLSWNASYKFGSWMLGRDGDRYHLVFSAKIDADCKPELLRAAIEGVLQVVSETKEEVVRLARASGIDRAALVGRWAGTLRGEDGSSVKLRLELAENGSFLWDEQSLVLRGEFSLTEGAIVVTVNGKRSRLGFVDAVDERQLALRVGDMQVTLTRQSPDADPAVTTAAAVEGEQQTCTEARS